MTFEACGGATFMLFRERPRLPDYFWADNPSARLADSGGAAGGLQLEGLGRSNLHVGDHAGALQFVLVTGLMGRPQGTAMAKPSSRG